MSEKKFVFQNTGNLINNDIVYPGSYSLENNSFKFTIKPKTKFWRLGIRLSKTETIDFYHPEHRYKKPEFDKFKDIHLSIGEFDKGWILPNRLQLAQYNLENYQHILNRVDTYTELGEIDWIIEYDYNRKKLSTLINASGCEPFSALFEVNEEYKYFKIFAWADGIDFEIDFTIEESININFEKEDFNKIGSYIFPTTHLTDNEKRYLEIIYQNFLASKKIDSHYSLQEIWNDFPSDFDPNKISQLLVVGGREITLLGIWHIHPDSDIFERFDKIILVIRNILKNGNLEKIITSELIQSFIKLTNLEILQVFKLMGQFNGFSRSLGSKENFTSHINIDSEQIYEQYRKYSGLQLFMNEYLRTNGAFFNPYNLEFDRETFIANNDEPIYSKTLISRKHSKDFNPVMGVIDLANDLAEIICALPEEKGQMIGIFGKWGRGKTFFIEELWKELEKKSDIDYIRVDYHAWKYQETPASWAYLYELLAKKYENKLEFSLTLTYFFSLFVYCWRIIKLNFSRLGFLSILILLVAILCSVILWFCSQEILGTNSNKPLFIIVPTTLLGLFGLFNHLKKEYSTKAIDLIKKYTIRHSFKDNMGIQANIQDELIKLLKVWLPAKNKRKNKIILVVEDIDRCTEEKIIQNIDALRVMLDDEEISKRLIIITAIDERILKNAIRTKYNSLIVSNNKTHEVTIDNDTTELHHDDKFINELISEYIDKLFISAIKLGGLNIAQKQEFLDELLKDQIEKSNIEKEIISKNEDPSTSNNKTNQPDFESIIDLAIRDNDFIIKDGDLALEDKDGNLISTLDIELNAQNKWEKLKKIEVTLLGEIIRDWTLATPRRISIFYFRYLLCKNLLIRKYTLMRETNVWQDKNGIKALMSLLLESSNKYDPDKISELKNKLISMPDSYKSTPIESISTFTVSKKDYLYLLEILEFVIAY